MKTIRLSISLFLLLFLSQTVTAQFGYKTREDDYLKGPVRLYKKTVLKDFAEKFGKYEAGTKQIKNWYLYDEKGRKIFDYIDRTRQGRATAYEKNIYYFDNDRLKVKARTFTIGDEKDDFRFTFYQYPLSKTMEEFPTSNYSGKKIKGFTKKYNSNNLLLEESEFLGKKGGYKKMYNYDKNGYKISYTEYNGIGDLTERIIWKRDNKGNLLEKRRYNAEGELIEKETAKYNNAGKLTGQVIYNSKGNENFRIRKNYLDDTLTIYVKVVSNGKVFHESTIEYDNNKRVKKEVYSVYWGDKTDRYEVFDYDNNNNLVEKRSFENQALIEKSVYSDYVDNHYLFYTKETYNADGSIKEKATEKNDRYGNQIAYEKYKYGTKFGGKVSIPIEKHEIDISYYDGTPNLDVQMKTVKERIHKKGKKEDVLHISIKNAKTKPIMYFFDKPGIIKYGGNKEKYKRIEGHYFNSQYSMMKRFYRKYFIVEAGNEIILVKMGV